MGLKTVQGYNSGGKGICFANGIYVPVTGLILLLPFLLLNISGFLYLLM
jgi:hypothetical protein